MNRSISIIHNPRDPVAAGSPVRWASHTVKAKLFVDGEEISEHELTDVVRDLTRAQHQIYRTGGLSA